MENEVLKLILSVEDKSVIKATQEAKRLEKEIKALVATEKVLGKEHDVVKQKTLEIKRKLQDYANISSQKAVPTLKKLIQAERTLSREVDKNTAALTRNTKATKTAANATNQYGSYAAGAGKKLNTMNMRIQQGGYQLQDLVVQLQSGTSFFTAFGQQGSQFAGIFGPQGAVLGAVIAIGSAIGGMALGLARASENAKTFSDGMSDARSALDEYKNSIDRVKDADLAQVFGDNTQAIIDMDEASLEFSSNLAKLNLAAGFTDLTASLDSSRTVMQGLARDSLGLLSTFNDIVTLGFFNFREKQQSMFSGESGLKSLGFTEGQLSKFGGSATLPNRLTGIQTQMNTGQFKDASEGVQQIFDILKGSGDELSASSLVFLNQLKESVNSALEIQASFNGTAQAAKDAAEDAKQADEDEKNRIKDLAAAELKLWKENNKYIEEQKRLDAEGDLAILNNRAQAERDLFSANSKYEREQDALRQRELDKTNKKVTELAERLSIPFSAALSLIRQAKAEATVDLDAFGGAGDFKYNVPTKFKPPSKTNKIKAPKDPLQELMKNLMLQKRLFGVEEDRASVMKALGESYSKYTPKQIDSAIELTESIRKQNEALEEQQDELDRLKNMAEQLASPFDDFFMALVDGTTTVSDAFKVMASDILKELYRVLVVKKTVSNITDITGDITDLFSGSNPFVVTGGSEFDGGGYTGSGSRSGGLDGKGGFMAMLHPRETVVDHTKGQGIGGATINQVFNISANTSDDTKRLITKTIEQSSSTIVNQSVNAVMDRRRRGGSMKSVFG